MFSSKKALSPLIAAVLLIVVVVGIGAVVTGIVRSTVSENQRTIEGKSDEMSCSRDVVIEVVKIDGEPQICKGSGYINAVLDNTGTVDIDDFQLKVFGTTGFYNNETLATGALSPGAAIEINGNFSQSAVGTVEQVQIVPKLRKTGATGYYFCADVAARYEGIADC